MFSPIFDGQYRSKPRVSLRGASRQEEKGKLLQRAHKEREKRELLRQQQHAAVTLQAHYRGHVHRQKLYGQLRLEFDSQCELEGGASGVLALSRLFLIFYQRDCDHHRLVRLCQKWLQYRHDLFSEACSNSICLFHLCHVLVCCCCSLRSLSLSQPLAPQLRLLEVFTDPSNYPPSHRHTASTHLCTHLVSNGYFRCLRDLLEQRVPPPEAPGPTHLPLTSSLLDFLTRPLQCVSDKSRPGMEQWRRLRHIKCLLYHSVTLTPHVCYLVLPHLVTFDFPLTPLLAYLSDVLPTGGLPPSLQLLYSLTQLVNPKLGSLSPASLSQYLRLLAVLLNHAPRVRATSRGGEEEEEEQGWIMEVEGEPDPLGSHDELLACCLAGVTGEHLPNRLRQEREVCGDVLGALCALCYQLASLGDSAQVPQRSRLFRHLALSPRLFPPLWAGVEGMNISSSFGEPMSCLQQLARGGFLPPHAGMMLVEQLTTFCLLFTLYLSTLHDAEFYHEMKGSFMPFSLPQLAAMVRVLRDVFVSLHLQRPLRLPSTQPTPLDCNCLKQYVHRLLCVLYERDCRRPFCSSGHWEALHMQHIPPELFMESSEEESSPLPASAAVTRQAELLKIAPFLFPFIERVKFFHQLVAHDKKMVQGHLQDFLLGPGLHVTARRSHIYQDAFSELAQGANLRQKLRVNLVNAQGLDEPGIDGGGVFREFLSELLKTGFDPNHGYFTTTQDGLLYPNPQAQLFNEDFAIHYQFLGGMLGKALYEGQLVELPFAGFFLCKLTDRGRGIVEAHHLASLDPELYRHLLSLKHYEGDIEELTLNFTVVSSEYGQSKVVVLKRGGVDISVTRTNYIEYIHLVAHYKLNVQLQQQFAAFREGLSSVVPLAWLRLFSQGELQVLISGAEVPIDVQDLRQNTTYSGEYTADHECIQMFWSVIERFSEQERCLLLKFVTSCSRPPLLGFKELYPPFCVMSGGREQRLPSASTCMNLLKLPMFPDVETMRSKLLYAISSGAGFELS